MHWETFAKHVSDKKLVSKRQIFFKAQQQKNKECN